MFDYKTIIEKKNRAFKIGIKKTFFFEKFSKITYSKAYELKKILQKYFINYIRSYRNCGRGTKIKLRKFIYYLSQYNFFKKIF